MSHELRTPFRSVATLRSLAAAEHPSRSSFYGLLDLLGGTELTAGQSEIGDFDFDFLRMTLNLPIVQTAKQSCELLLKVVSFYMTLPITADDFLSVQIIDSILDYSKLEASGEFGDCKCVLNSPSNVIRLPKL